MHIGLFGGTFDPPHLGHLVIAETIRDQYALDQIWWIPAYQSPHKTGNQATATQRLAMTRQATAAHPAFRVLDMEIARSGVSYTIDTLRHLTQQHPEHQFRLIMGGDNLAGFDTWRDPAAILALASLIVYARPGVPTPVLPTHLAERVSFADAMPLHLSSTAIRTRFQEDRSIRYLVPENVHTYICEQGLYHG